MKRILAILLAGMMLLSLAACNLGSRGSGNGASKKTDQGQIVEHEDEEYNKFLEMSGLKSIGTPVGYTFDGDSSVGSGVMLTFTADSGEVKETDLAPYVAAIWNLLIDVADEGKIKNSSGEVYKEFSDLGSMKKMEILYYSLDGQEMFLEFHAESGKIKLQVHKLGS